MQSPPTPFINDSLGLVIHVLFRYSASESRVIICSHSLLIFFKDILLQLLDFGVEACVEARVEACVEARVEACVEACVEAPVEARVEAPVEACVEACAKACVVTT